MIKDYKLKDIEKYLQKDSKVGDEIINAFDSLADAAIIFSPIVFGPQLLPLLDLLDVKDRLFNLGRKVYNYIASKIETDYIDRTEQIRSAYALICYTSYLEVLERKFPQKIIKEIKTTLQDKKDVIYGSIEQTDEYEQNSPNIHCSLFIADHITSFSEIKEDLGIIYSNITNKLFDILITASNINDKKEIENLKKVFDDIPKEAVKTYESQYIHLADSFNDFALFAQLQNFNGINTAVKQNKKALDLLLDNSNKIDVGLTRLSNIVNSIYTNYRTIQVQSIVNNLKDRYHSIIEEAIIDDKEIKSDTEEIRLSFPKIVDAFIPQSYKCLLYEHKDIHLEDENIWNDLPRNDDLDKFFVKYLFSPDSVDYPLIILGHPGSGKSLLTKVLSAQLISNSYTVIRIPLREVNAENGIDVLIEDQIKSLTNKSLPTGYGDFAEHFNEKPLMIILDGYDELLQAKGDVFSGYLEKVRIFQQEQKSMKRPVRIIITSRITLIDKARVPVNSTVLRLLEFNDEQRKAWISIWNNINSEYFINSGIKPFCLPKLSDKNKKNNIMELAEQPLLLLMLALYDSEANELAQTNSIKRTELYDNLLRRFVRRERGRYVPGFNSKKEKEQEKIIDQEMNRLGVAAIGMYNRQEVVISSKQLENDLDIFRAHRNDGSPSAHTLQESDSLLGGFFFIHKSKAKDIEENSTNVDSAYEFLHNTFGEFLAADFILRNTITEVKDVYIGREYGAQSLNNKLENPDGFNSNWFYCLMFVPLYSRPVVIEMLREHAPKALLQYLRVSDKSIEIKMEDFIENLKFIVHNQIEIVLNKRNVPSVMCKETLFERNIPLIGYLATYSLNLIILASALCQNGFEFIEDDYCPSQTTKNNSKQWDKLISLWKTWFSPADLAGLSVIVKAKRTTKNSVIVNCNDKFEAIRYEKPIDILLCVSSTLADNLLTGLSGLQTHMFREITRLNNAEILDMLREENLDLYCSFLILLVQEEMNNFTTEDDEHYEFENKYTRINDIMLELLNKLEIYHSNRNTLLNFILLVECCLQRKVLFSNTKVSIVKALPDLIMLLRSHLDKYTSSQFTVANKLMETLLSVDDQTINEKLLLNNFNFSNSLIRAEFEEEIERSIHYSYRYYKQNRIYLHNEIWEDSNRMTILKLLENPRGIAEEDKNRLFYNYINFNSLQLLIKLNPQALSNTLLYLVERRKNKDDNLNKIIHYFFEMSLEELEHVGLSFFGLNTITNLIKIAQILDKNNFLETLTGILKKHFINNRNILLNLLSDNPAFIAYLLERLPKSFAEILPFCFKIFVSEKRIRYQEPNKMYDYLRLFRKMYNYVNSYTDSENIVDKNVKSLSSIVLNNCNSKNFDVENITFAQLDDLAWFCSTLQNKHIQKKAKSLLYKNSSSEHIDIIELVFHKYD